MKHEGRLEGHEITPRDARIDVKYDAQVRFGGSAVDAMILNVSKQRLSACMRPKSSSPAWT